MGWLILGLFLWFFAHGFKAFFPNTRQKLTDRFGEEQSKGPIALGILLSFIFIVIGWRASDPAAYFYIPIYELRIPAMILLVVGLYFFMASGGDTRIRQWIRHPQLTGLSLWAIAHLLVNGEIRSVLLFGALGLWAVVLMPFINRRDGIYEKPGIGSWPNELKPIVGTVIATAILVATHGFYTAIPLVF